MRFINVFLIMFLVIGFITVFFLYSCLFMLYKINKYNYYGLISNKAYDSFSNMEWHCIKDFKKWHKEARKLIRMAEEFLKKT